MHLAFNRSNGPDHPACIVPFSVKNSLNIFRKGPEDWIAPENTDGIISLDCQVLLPLPSW